MLQKLASLDRRIIYGALILTIVVALVNPIGLAIIPGSEMKTVYGIVDSLPAGAIVFLGMDYTGAGVPELEPATLSMIRQGFAKGLRFVAMGVASDMGGDAAEVVFQELKAEFPEKKYGVDWVNLGYKPGGEVLLQQMITSVDKACVGEDFYGNPLSSLPIMAEFPTIDKASLVVTMTNSLPERWYIKHVTGPYKIPFIFGAMAAAAPTLMPLITSGQINGIITGLKGAAEYEVLVNHPGEASAGMDAQSFCHALIILFIAIANIGYFATRAKTKRPGTSRA